MPDMLYGGLLHDPGKGVSKLYKNAALRAFISFPIGISKKEKGIIA